MTAGPLPLEDLERLEKLAAEVQVFAPGPWRVQTHLPHEVVAATRFRAALRAALSEPPAG